MQINAIEYFEKGALLKCPEKVAVIDQENRHTFGEIGQFAKNCAALILKKRPTLRRPIPVFLPKSAQTIVANLGILYSGNGYANLDVKSPPQRLKGMLQNLNAEVIITSAPYVAALRALDIPEEQLVLVEEAMVSETRYDNAVLLKRLEAVIDTDPYCFIHTSGSTGIPKGVALTHRNTIDFVDWAFERLNLDGGEVMGSLAPIYFDAYTLEFCLCIAKGATWIVVPDQCAMFPVKLVEFVASHPINFIFWVPTIMVNVANQDLLAKVKLDRITKVFFIGEVFPTKHLNCVRGSSLALGYWNNPERTAKGFIQNPLNPHHPELIYRTGDLGYWNSRGEIMFLGRQDFQIKHLGYRIELGEIEHAVLQLEGMRNCCVVYNQNKKEITLFFECDQQRSPAFIRERLSASLPKYMLPTVFNQMELLPRNPNGKIDRQKLVSSVN
jgi:non-ribosomal peptide synthetase component F